MMLDEAIRVWWWVAIGALAGALSFTAGWFSWSPPAHEAKPAKAEADTGSLFGPPDCGPGRQLRTHWTCTDNSRYGRISDHGFKVGHTADTGCSWIENGVGMYCVPCGDITAATEKYDIHNLDLED